MKKEVLLVTILVIIVSLSAVVYAAALTNPGHGVEEIGSGSSPYAPFRDWNVLEAGYEDQYSGPSGLKSNVFWLATLNAETLAAQNSSADWCALQVHPSGIYMNCFNNASNMTLFNSYYWNGTNFTKNDTIKNGTTVIEKKVLQVNEQGGEEIFEITNSNGDSAGSSITATPGTASTGMISTNGATSTGASVSTSLTAGQGTATMTGENIDGATTTSVTTAGSTGTTTVTGTDGAETGTATVTPGEVTATGDDGAGNTGGEGIFDEGLDFSVSAGGVADYATLTLEHDAVSGAGKNTAEITDGASTLFSSIYAADANGGTLNLDITDTAIGTNTIEITANHNGAGNNPSFITKINDAATGNIEGDLVLKEDNNVVKVWGSIYDPALLTEQSMFYIDYNTVTTESKAILFSPGDTTVAGENTVSIDAGTGTTNITMNSTEIRFWTNHSTRMYIGENGKTGVGLINPQTMLDIINATRVVPQSSPPYVCAIALEGAIYYDSDVHRLCFCNSTAWIQVDDSNTTCS
ncbi:hypothetical protein GF343_02625 [Candidatus Woesearchaeota archaeon]|nr:hypothetical protein [Candidatus Woesearchaeota archaeon]